MQQAPSRALSTVPRLIALWALVGGALSGMAGVLLWFRHRFDWALELRDIPALPLMMGLIVAGLVFLCVLPLISRTAGTIDSGLQRRLLWLVVGVGLLLRLMMLPTEPALEDDQQRYLWEGALVANGLSPYAIAPADTWRAPAGSPLDRLAGAAGPVLERVNHPGLKTIYPPVAEAAFALAYLLEPFSLTAWRLVLLAADMATLGLLVRLLDAAGRPRLWVALYWWNPLVIKEVFNSAHMEGVLTPFVLLALLLAIRRRPLLATGVLGLGVGVKIWPLLLLPLILRPVLDRPRIVIGALAIMASMVALWALPILLGGLDARSGFRAYAADWQANSALLPALRGLSEGLLATLGQPVSAAGMIARLALAITVGLVALAIVRTPLQGAADVMARAAIVTLALVLLSPAQFPWYAIWTIPFLPFAPRWGVMAMAVLLPIYYASFHFAALGRPEIFRGQVVWLIWAPIWLLLARDAWLAWRARRLSRRTSAATA